MTVRYPGFDTLALHAGQPPDPTTGSRAVPIYATASYVFEDSDHAAALFNMERAGHVYSRISNPTVAVFEERMAALEKGVGAIATASGQAALHLAIVTLMGAGSHIVASRALYGGSHNLLGFTLARFGIDTTFVDPRDLGAWQSAIRPNTRLLFGETLGNPGLDVLDIPAVSAIAHQNGVPLLVDSTFTTPYLMTPFDHGADLVYHSATKFIGGHGVAIGGVLIDGGTFDWLASGKFLTLTQPYVGFHGMNFAEESTVAPFLLRARREGLRDFGACMSPHTAFFLLQGLETLPLRMQRHVDNTRKVVAFLADHPMIESVAYPELPSHPDHAAGATTVAARMRRGVQLQPEGVAQRRTRFRRSAARVLAPCQRRRREVAGDSSGIDHAFSRSRSRTGSRRHYAGNDPALGRAGRRD